MILFRAKLQFIYGEVNTNQSNQHKHKLNKGGDLEVGLK
jgi:hypothetical protein